MIVFLDNVCTILFWKYLVINKTVKINAAMLWIIYLIWRNNSPPSSIKRKLKY